LVIATLPLGGLKCKYITVSEYVEAFNDCGPVGSVNIDIALDGTDVPALVVAVIVNE
jgi:hypothetical protein